MQFSVKADVASFRRVFALMRDKQIRFATAVALTKTAKAVEKEIIREIPRVFNRPTPYTLRSTYVTPATKARLSAEVKIKDHAVKGNPAIRFLSPGIHGGGRSLKGFERLLQRAGVMPDGWYAVPGSAVKLDAYGNVTGATLVKILSALRASSDSLQNRTGSKRSKRKAATYFVALPGRTQTRHLHPGIYRRQGAYGADIAPMFLFTKRRPQYRKRLRFYEIAERVTLMRFPMELRRAALMAQRTAR